MQTFRLYLLAIVTVVVVVACDRVPLTSPTGSTISISADRTILPLNGQTTVRAVVTESAGTPVHNGTMVTFQPSIGTTNPVEAATVNGIATVTFLAGGVSGTGFIHAFSGGARTGSGNASSGGVEVRIGAAAAGSISVSASPSSVSQSGGTVTVSALVLDSANNPLPGVSVLFTTSTGTLGSTTALSDENGIARTTLNTTQTAVVEAIAGAAKGNVRVEVSTAPTLTIEPPSPASPIAGQPVAITVTTTSGNASAPRQVQTLSVNFGDGTAESRSNVTGSAAFTHIYGRAGGYTISAQAVDVAGNTANASRAIVVSAAPLPTVGITADDTTPLPNTQTVTFTITAAPASGGPPLQEVRATLNGEVLFSGTGGGSFARRFPQGTHVIQVSATDINGNEARSSITIVAEP